MKDEVLIINNNNENKKISNNKIETNLSKKVLKQEHKLYPAAIMKIFN